MTGKESTDNHESYMTMNEAGVLVPDYDQTIKVFDDGDIVIGDVVKIDRDEVLVDIGYKSEGAIPIRELSIKQDVDPNDIVKVGDRIEALVLQKEDKDGRLILSKKRAEFEQAWGRIEKVANDGGSILGEVIEIVKGGLILNIGLRGFLPASLIDVKRTKDLEQYLGQEMECKIIEMDRNRNNVVLSRRAVLEEERKHEKSKILEKVVKGAKLPGKISSIVDFGAFVDLGGIDGLIHISELCWDHIDHPSEIVSVGDEVNVQVLEVELERGRISLGLKQTTEDPWKARANKFSVGQISLGKVTKIMPFGAFVQIEEGLEGLIHISELSHKHVETPNEVVKVSDEVEAKIVGIDLERRRISLSIKQAQPAVEEPSEETEAALEGSIESPEQDQVEIQPQDVQAETQAQDEQTETVESASEAIQEDQAEVETTEAEVAESAEETAEVAVEEIAEETVEEVVSETVEEVVEEVVEDVEATTVDTEEAVEDAAEVTSEVADEDAVAQADFDSAIPEEVKAEIVEEVAVKAEVASSVGGSVDPDSLEAVLKQMKEDQAKKGSAE